MRALRLLDEIQRLPQLEAFEPRNFIDAVAAEMPAPGETLAELAASLDALRSLLGDVDRFAQKSMNIHLVQSLGDVVPQRLRALLTATVQSYASDLGVLKSRITPGLQRVNAGTAADVADRIITVATGVLAARAQLRDGVLALAQTLATARLPSVQKAARDRSAELPERQRWGQARIDLEQIIAAGAALDTGTFAERLTRIPPPPDEPDPDPGSRFALLDID